MSFFRQTLNLDDATARPVAAADHSAIARLIATVRRRFLVVPSEELPRLAADEPGALLVCGAAVWAAAVGERAGDEAAWLRALVLAEALPQEKGLDALLAAYHERLRASGVRRSFYTGREGGDIWLRAALAARGYTRHTEVVVYEKLRMDVPTQGSRSVDVRAARPADLAEIRALDRVCFTDQWHKNERAIAPALATSPCFLVAEWQRQLQGAQRGAVGYAFVTSHYDGRLIHLVRIAVHPSAQGQGIGARLLADVIGYARGSGADTVTLNTQQDNAARRMYERFGFRRTGERQTVMEFAL